MIKICKLKLDGRGRFCLPLGFLKANNISKDSECSVIPVAGRDDAIKLEFKKGKKKVKSVENRIVIFDAMEEHTTVTQTDKDVRLVLNINYYP